MSVIRSLFGTSKPDYATIIRNVASNGFGQGIVDVKYDDFARYLRTHAQVVRSTPDGLEAECRSGEKDHLISLERERTGGRDTGSTRVSISVKISFDWNDPKIGEILIDLYRPLIKTRSDAENAALAVYWRGLGLFVSDTKAGGEMKRGSQCSVVVPSALKSFGDRFPEDHVFITHQRIQDLDVEMMHAAGQTELQVKVRYAIADAIVREYRLLS